MEHRYFKAAGKSLEIVRAFLQTRTDVFAARQAYRREIGAEHLWGADSRILGATFSAAAPAGFKPSPKEGEGVHRPDKRTKAGKALMAAMRKLDAPDLTDLTHKLGSDWVFGPRTGGGPQAPQQH